MNLDVWDLPGPRSFLRSVVERLVSGSSAVVLWPECAPSGFSEALRLAELHGRYVFDASQGPDEAPIDIVYRAALGEVPSNGARTPGRLAGDEQVHGLVVHVSQIQDSATGEWARFLEAYADAVRTIAPGDRMSVVLELSGAQTRAAPRSDVTLDVVKWDDWANEGDAFILASSIVRGNQSTPRRRAFVSASVARLAQWDLDMAAAMCGLDDSEIADPKLFLQGWAKKLGWSDLTDPAWEHGTLHTVDGQQTLHSAYLSVRDPEALDKRMWSAHAGLFLPWIEERRIKLLPRLNGHIQFPLQTDAGQVDRVQDLSIGQIAWAIRDSRVDPQTKRTIGRLREARNRLAHLQPLPAELALHQDLIE